MDEPTPGFQTTPAFTSHRLYPADEVDAHIHNLIAQIDQLRHTLEEANERAARAEHRAGNLDHAEERVGRAFVVAQEAADATLREAEMSAGSVVTEARRRAELLLAKAREDALSVVESARKTVA
jgi:cell division septum initiation protein DivIVA